MHNVGALLIAALTLFAIVFGLWIAENPMLTGEPVGGRSSIWCCSATACRRCSPSCLRWSPAARGPMLYRIAAAAIAVLLMLSYLSLEVRTLYHGPVLDRGLTTDSEQYTYSVVWLAYGVVLLLFGIWLRSQPARLASAAVTLLTVGKVFLIDMSDLTGVLPRAVLHRTWAGAGRDRLALPAAAVSGAAANASGAWFDPGMILTGASGRCCRGMIFDTSKRSPTMVRSTVRRKRSGLINRPCFEGSDRSSTGSKRDLFKRNRSGYTLTPRGEQMVRLAERMEYDVAAFERGLHGEDERDRNHSSPGSCRWTRSLSRSGLEFLKDMIDGKLPQAPMCATLGFHLAEVAEGYAVFEGLPEFRHYNPIGTVHGGFAATLLDSALGCAIFTHARQGRGLDHAGTQAQPGAADQQGHRPGARRGPHHPPRTHGRDLRGHRQGSRRQALRPRHDDLHDLSGEGVIRAHCGNIP